MQPDLCNSRAAKSVSNVVVKADTGRKVLLVTYFFPPMHSVASLRTYSFACYLAEAGFEVTVLTVSRVADRAISLKLPTNKFCVVGCDFQPPDFSGASPASHGVNLVVFRLLRRLKLWWLGNLVTPWDLWFKPGLAAAQQLMRDNRYDCVISSHGPISCHLIALRLKKKFPSLFWVADYRDLWSHQHFGTVAKFPFSLLQRVVEQRINKSADLLVTVSQPWRDKLIECYAKECLLVENGYLPGDAVFGDADRVVFPKEYTFIYTGVFYEGKYDPVPFFEALRQLLDTGEVKADQVEVRFYGPNSHLLRGSVNSARLQVDLVKLMPLVSREEALRIQRGATALIFFAQDKPEALGVLTGKIYEYLVAGPPILACGVRHDSAAGQLLAQTTTGFICGSEKKEIIEALRSIIAGKTPTPNIEMIKQYRRDRLVGKLAELLREKLAVPTRDHKNATVDVRGGRDDVCRPNGKE